MIFSFQTNFQTNFFSKNKLFYENSPMRSLKKVHVLVAFVVVTCVFFLFQFSFISNIKLRSNQADSNQHANAPGLPLKPKKHVELNHLNDNLKNVEKNNANTKKRSKLLLPLDKDGHPFLNYSLPFFYSGMLYSHFGFKIVFVDDDVQISPQNSLNKIAGTSEFIGIEAENKMIDKNSLRTYDVQSEKAPGVRGINQNKAELYQPDTNGQFSCLNSNVG